MGKVAQGMTRVKVIFSPTDAVIPDVVWTSHERAQVLLDAAGQFTGAPEIVIEVLSQAQKDKERDRQTKLKLYSKQGVLEYWILDLATTALIALAQAIPDDDWAQRQLYKMGIPTSKQRKEHTSEVGGNRGITAKTGEKDLPIIAPEYPSVSLDTLLQRAKKQYSHGVVIAMDDLDKQNPSPIRQLMYDAQGMLKGPAWFLLTGHHPVRNLRTLGLTP